MAANHEASFRMPPPFTERSLLQGSPFLREGTGVPSPRRGVSSETPPSQGEKDFSQSSPPWREHVCNMLPKETVRGSCNCRLYTPSTIPPVPLPPGPTETYYGKPRLPFQLHQQANLLRPCTCMHSLPHTCVCRFQQPVQNTVFIGNEHLSGSQITVSFLAVTLPSPFHVVGKPISKPKPTKKRR